VGWLEGALARIAPKPRCSSSPVRPPQAREIFFYQLIGNHCLMMESGLTPRRIFLVSSCAKVGIIALIDEATGFQQVRKKRALQIKLQAFIAEEMQDWAQMFPPEFWFELARLEGVHYSPKNRPLRWGKYIMAFVYDTIDKDMGKALRNINPDPSKGKNDHQLLTDFGRQQVKDQINRVVTIMKLCENMKDFRQKFDRVFRKAALQMDFTEVWEANQ
jgi:hypothetical protein